MSLDEYVLSTAGAFCCGGCFVTVVRLNIAIDFSSFLPSCHLIRLSHP
jgi:hypothetical protein